MKVLFEEIERDGVAAIQRVLTAGQQENVGLDFKIKSNQNHGQLDKTDRQILAKALSAFANSAGGLIVYGVACKPDADGVDAASDAVPIKDLPRFQSDVTRAVGELLLPRHEGIQILAIPNAGQASVGYLAVWVERSERRPHQSQQDRLYYKRAGSSTYSMEHFDIEDAFRRLATPQLELAVSVDTTGPHVRTGGIEWRQHKLVLSLRNDSIVSAKFPYLHVLHKERLGELKNTWPSYMRLHKERGMLLFDGNADVVVHPEQSVAVAALSFNVQTVRGQSYLTIGNDVQPEPNGPLLAAAEVVIRCVFGAENCRQKSAEHRLSGSEIISLMSR